MSAKRYFNNWDRVKETLLKVIARPGLPRWGLSVDTSKSSYSQRSDRPLVLEIVSHCWQYSELLNYQLASLCENPPQTIRIVMTVFYAEEDTNTAGLLARYADLTPPNIYWQWRTLPKHQLFRRAIGRNLAALESTADWLWFTDCDVVFRGHCLDQLNVCLAATEADLVYPAIEWRSEVLAQTKSLQMTTEHNNAFTFIATPLTRATGPMQITRGDVARQQGYCRNIQFYQKPALHWCKASEDRVFRWLLGSQGEAIDVDGVSRIQHQHKGRYASNQRKTKLRICFQNIKMRSWKGRFEQSVK